MGDPFRVLFTGSREWRDEAMVEQTLCFLAKTHPESIVIVVGDNKAGLDAITRRLCARLGIEFEEHIARWWDPCEPTCRPGHRRSRRQGTYCPAQGNYRNTRMAQSGIRLCCAFFKHQAPNKGTSDCVGAAKDAGLPDDLIWRYRR